MTYYRCIMKIVQKTNQINYFCKQLSLGGGHYLTLFVRKNGMISHIRRNKHKV